MESHAILNAQQGNPTLRSPTGYSPEFIGELMASATSAEVAGDLDVAARALALVIDALRESSRHDDVIALAQRGVVLCSDPKLGPYRLHFLLAASWRFLRMVALESAMLALKEAGTLAREQSNQAAEAEILRQVALLQDLSGDLTAGQMSIARSVEIFRGLEDGFGLSEALLGLAVTFWKSQQFEEAANYFREAIASAVHSGNWTCAVHANANLANYYLARSDLSGAGGALSEAERIFSTYQLQPFWGWAIAQANRGAYYDLAGQTGDAITFLKAAALTCEDLNEKLARPLIERELALLYRKANQLELALTHTELAHRYELANAMEARRHELQSLKTYFELDRARDEKRVAHDHQIELEKLVQQRTQDLHNEVAERKRAEQVAHRLAHHDPLTGLCNRTLLGIRLNAMLARAQENQAMVAVLFVDLDNFKEINDVWGHERGDRALFEVAERMRATDYPDATLCRFGGDEFVVVLPCQHSLASVHDYIARLQQSLVVPLELGSGELQITPSIGVSVYPQDSERFNELIAFADVAMYSAKQRGRNRAVFFDAQMRAELSARAQLRHDFPAALAAGGIFLLYQPLVEARSGRVVALEALSRWQHPVFGLIEPARFIPLVEESGLVQELGNWVLDAACLQVSQWRAAGHPQLWVSVNVSQKQLQDADFFDVVASTLERHQLDAQALEIEVTESVMMQEGGRASDLLAKISGLGVRIALDDFGTGYSSLSLLSQLPIDGIKVDQSFIRSMLVRPADQTIAETIIRMAKALRKTVICEGVEAAEQLAILHGQEADGYQGFLFAPPTPVDEILELLGRDFSELFRGQQTIGLGW